MLLASFSFSRKIIFPMQFSLVCLIDFLLRHWTANRKTKSHQQNPIKGKIHWKFNERKTCSSKRQRTRLEVLELTNAAYQEREWTRKNSFDNETKRKSLRRSWTTREWKKKWGVEDNRWTSWKEVRKSLKSHQGLITGIQIELIATHLKLVSAPTCLMKQIIQLRLN